MNQTNKPKFLYKDELCDAIWTETTLTCQKGTLTLPKDNITSFDLYCAWCKGCDKIQVVERKDFIKQFKTFVKNVEKVLEEEK